jgi:hypothetical protein
MLRAADGGGPDSNIHGRQKTGCRYLDSDTDYVSPPDVWGSDDSSCNPAIMPPPPPPFIKGSWAVREAAAKAAEQL